VAPLSWVDCACLWFTSWRYQASFRTCWCTFPFCTGTTAQFTPFNKHKNKEWLTNVKFFIQQIISFMVLSASDFSHSYDNETQTLHFNICHSSAFIHFKKSSWIRVINYCCCLLAIDDFRKFWKYHLFTVLPFDKISILIAIFWNAAIILVQESIL